MKNIKNRKKIIIIVILFIFIISISLFFHSHRTYWKYNDNWIIGNSIENIQERYGTFTRNMGSSFDGSFSNSGGIVGYYIYTDNSMVMPDHLPYYYWIKYNSEHIVEKVWVATLPGG